MKTAHLIILFLGINLVSIGQTIEFSGIINSDTIWTTDTVKLIGDVTVQQGVRLTVNPGVIVQLQDYYTIYVNGSLHANGSVADSITFTVADTSGFYANLYSLDGSWNGIHIIGEDGNSDTSIFKYCRLEYGKNFDTILGDINGGVLYVNNYGTLRINNSLFTNNSSIAYVNNGSRGGAIYCEEVKSLLINANLFSRNYSNYCGGAISIDKRCESVEISSNYFIKNTGNLGAAIHSSDLSYGHVIANNYCSNNYNALNGIIYTSNPYGWIYNNIICNNEGIGIVDGHGMSVTKIFGNTIVNNTVSFHSSAILLHSKAYVYNNICWGNIDQSGNIYDQIYVPEYANPDLKNNCVEYGDGGINAVYDYPEFVNPSSGSGPQYDGLNADWTLLDYSPCINTGTPDTTGLELPEYDIAGNPRVFGGRIDIGAYENQSVYLKINDSPLYSKIKLYPNPGTDIIYIDIPPEMDGAWIDIVDGQGRIMMHEQIRVSPAVLSPYKLKSGIYFYRIYNENKVVKSGKWVKK